MLEVHLSRDLAKSLHLTPLVTPAAAAAAGATPHADQTSASAGAAATSAANGANGSSIAVAANSSSSSSSQQVSVAHVRALLTHQAGVWRLDPLPGGTKTEAVAAALQLQQEGSAGMLWGSVELTTLLGDLQVRLLSTIVFTKYGQCYLTSPMLLVRLSAP
jgi:hypothetical protein